MLKCALVPGRGGAVAVSGVTLCHNRYLVGRRSNQVTHYPGSLELVPSGSLDLSCCKEQHCDFVCQLQSELLEETGFASEAILSMEPFGVIHDLEGHVVDICIRVNLKEENLEKLPEANSEYQEFFWLDESELSEKCKKAPQDFVPTSICLINEQQMIF